MTDPNLTAAIHNALAAAQNLGLAIGGGPAAPDLDESLAAAEAANRRLFAIYHGVSVGAVASS